MDASALVEWMLPGPRQDEVTQLFADPSVEMVAPDLVLAEAANVFRTAWRTQVLSSDALATLMDDLADVSIETVGIRGLLPLMVPLLPELSAYDACYLALAGSRGVPLATFDRKLAREAEERGVTLLLARG